MEELEKNIIYYAIRDMSRSLQKMFIEEYTEARGRRGIMSKETKKRLDELRNLRDLYIEKEKQYRVNNLMVIWDLAKRV